MESNHTISYDVAKSAERIDNILYSDNSNFSDKNSIPLRSLLTYTNGFYVNVTALFIDIVGSSDMSDEHKRPTLAKMYRAFISECVALMNDKTICKEINIHGDCVWGVFDTPYKADIDTAFNVAYSLNSMIKILNYKLDKRGYGQISVGIGLDYGRALMVKAGYNGSGINDVIWMGDVVNAASHISNTAGRDGKYPIIASSTIYNNLNEHNQGLLNSFYDWTLGGTYYGGNIINTDMEDWYNENCK